LEEHGTWLHWLYYYKYLPENIPEMVPETIVMVLVLCTLAIVAGARLRTRNHGRFQAFVEFVVTSFENLVKGIVGEKLVGSLAPVIGSFFLFVLSMNLLGLIPGFTSPTANINTAAGLALCAFVMVQYYGFKAHGIRYLKHFLGEPLWLAPLMLPIHIIGELARPLSLTIRLFGNIFGEDMVLIILILITKEVIGTFLLPAQFPMMLFGVFTSFVQALVFSMLVAIYIAVATEQHEEAH